MEKQLGIWEDTQIQGLIKIVDVVHEEGCNIFVQIHQAGVVGISKTPMCPSNYQYENHQGTKITGYEMTGHEMTLEDIHLIQMDFIQAGGRAYEAGYDGIELHGCHQYLISQYFNGNVNKERMNKGFNQKSLQSKLLMESVRLPRGFCDWYSIG